MKIKEEETLIPTERELEGAKHYLANLVELDEAEFSEWLTDYNDNLFKDPLSNTQIQRAITYLLK